MLPKSPAPASFARPQRVEQTEPENRGSMLRASILESALELGVGSSRTVANWMFNPVEEGDEEEVLDNQGIVSPSLTYASTATSEESNLSAGLTQPQRTQPGAGILINTNGSKDALSLDTSAQYSQRNGLSPARGSPDPTQRTLQFDLRATPEPRAISPAPSAQPQGSLLKGRNKLRKPNKDGYESDGGYVSESGKSKKEREKKEKKEKKEKEKKSKKKGTDKDGEGEEGATDYESDGGHLSEASAKRKKSKKEKKEKEKKEKDKSKSKSADSPATDYETDKGYSSSFSKALSRKQSSVTSPVSGDESDGGYLSESSKKRRFFRLNSKSRKKQDSLDSSQDQPPPVPALPDLTLPIHEKWRRANSPIPPDAFSDVRPSVETFNSMDTSTSADTSITAGTSSTTIESDETRHSVVSHDGLTKAFADAESVRSPSIDFLSSFRRPGAGSPLSPSKFNPFHYGQRPGSPPSPKSRADPTLSPSKSARSRPQISAPNTTSLAPKHVPVPLTLTPPTPTSHTHPSPDPDYVLVTPNPSTPTAAADSTSANAATAPPPPSPTLVRPKVLAYYDLPPPSPPPRGPLPDVPSDISRSTSPSWSVMDSSPARFPRSAPADTNDPRNAQRRNIPIASPVDRPNTAAHPFSQDVPIVAQPVPPVQRGRVSPFPTAPVLPREQTRPLMRQTSKVTREAVNRVLNQNMPASASPYPNGHGRWPSNEVRVEAPPASAQPYFAGDSRWPSRPTDQLGVRWAPRSASAMDTRRPQEGDGTDSDDGRSWLVYDDEEVEEGKAGISNESLSVPNTRPASTEPPEPSPDVNAILAGFRAQRDAEAAARQDRARSTKTDTTSKHDTVAGIVAGYERDTVYLDAEEGGGDRSSVWSDANSRYSFLDDERSAEIRAKFVKRVEAMYGKELVPPVPRLDQSLSSRGG
ncbi:hypothetical protein BD309DRAFT_874566 [Dichomitus squalens]|uniref:Uncharacterized protein n=1 Tax=Dichomitus squalens TaxID=114155 RepID=A0A4Q9NDL3_9APHY|nr:hypothetical protein BD309DRAFT_874566 [Dichomitus squalens]TBU53465.1 hypothetical protein BD310DRAFT_909478 [Dichomitus squalens]